MSEHLPIEQTDAYKKVILAADGIWHLVQCWDSFAKQTLGQQLARSVDSVGANLVEGDGRYSDAEALHHFEFARGSGREALYWLNAAHRRNLITAEQFEAISGDLQTALKMLNGLMNYRRRTKNVSRVRELDSPYLQPYTEASVQPQFPHSPVDPLTPNA